MIGSCTCEHDTAQTQAVMHCIPKLRQSFPPADICTVQIQHVLLFESPRHFVEVSLTTAEIQSLASEGCWIFSCK